MDDWKNRLMKNMLPNYSMVGNRQEQRKPQEQGAAKRRQEEESYHYPGMAEGGYPSKSKRPCLEDVTLSMGVPRAHASAVCTELQPPPMPMNPPRPMPMNPSSAAMGVTGHSLMLENNPMNGSVMGSPYAVAPPTDMSLKGAPHLVPYCDKSNNDNSNMQAAVDQELQELLEELTKIQEPGSAELDLEKILGNKPEEPLLLEHSQVSLAVPAKPTVQMPHMESLVPSKEFPPSCSQVPGIALPMPSSSAGVSYGLPPTSKQMMSPTTSGVQAKNPAQARPPIAMPQIPVPQWHHAHQLKALAASKQGSATKQQQAPTPSWSGLPPPGVSPPYRPVPSPHPPPPPFSSQSLLVSCMSSGTMQSSSGALLPSMPYMPNPALSQQQSQFTQQSSILAHLVSSTIKHPQGHMLTALPTSTPGPSPPYRPEKLASPGLPQQSFTPQCSLVRSLPTSSSVMGQQQQQQQQQMANAMFKPMSTNASKAPFGMLMPPAMASTSHGAPEPLSFGNTKPLSHYMSEPGPSKMPPMPAPSRHASLLHYLQQPPTMPSSATASSTATATLQLQQHDPSTFLLQQVMQQPQRYQQRVMGPDALSTLPRQQGKQTSGRMATIPEQRRAYTAQQLRQFQAVQEQVIFDHSRTTADPASNQHVTPPGPGGLSTTFKPGMTQQPGLCYSGVPVPFLSAPVRPHTYSTRAAPSGAPLSGFCLSSLGIQHPSPDLLRASAAASTATPTTVISSAMWMLLATATHEGSRVPSLSQIVGSSIQQCLEGRAVFTQAFPALPSTVPPRQMATGNRPSLRANVQAAASPGPVAQLSPVPAPVPVPIVTMSSGRGWAGSDPRSPIQAIEPPSSVAAAATTAAASAVATSQSLERPRALSPLAHDAAVLPDDCELPLIFQELMQDPDEPWQCDLRMIDDILGEHTVLPDTSGPEGPGGDPGTSSQR